ncbi:MAG: hypothetical protein OXC67_11530 [Flavobacteriaceae bacterium]|nr:hypothetical protein [Flavobacteriaceae bacterium]
MKLIQEFCKFSEAEKKNAILSLGVLLIFIFTVFAFIFPESQTIEKCFRLSYAIIMLSTSTSIPNDVTIEQLKRIQFGEYVIKLSVLAFFGSIDIFLI